MTVAVPEDLVMTIRERTVAHRARAAAKGGGRVRDLPGNRAGRPRIAASLDTEAARFATAAFKGLRTTVVQGMAELGCNGVMVTGPTANVGKSTVAINLAAALARQPERRVILVELDLRAPTLADALGLDVTSGIERAVYTGFDARGALLAVPGLGFHALACGGAQTDSSEILSSPGFRALLETLSTRWEHHTVVFDAPPALGCDDVPALAPAMRAAVMVVQEGRTTRAELRGAIGALGGVPVLSVVSNRSRSTGFKRYYY